MKCRNENCNVEIPENAEICQTCRTTGYLTQICPTCNIILDVTQSSCPYCDQEQVQNKYLTPKDEEDTLPVENTGEQKKIEQEQTNLRDEQRIEQSLSGATNYEESEKNCHQIWFHVLVERSILDDNLFEGIVLKVKDKGTIESYWLNIDEGIKNKDYISLEVSMSKSHMYNYNYHFQYEGRITKEARIRGRSISKHPGQNHVYDGIVRKPKSQGFFGSRDVEVAADIFVGQLEVPSTANGFTGLVGKEILIRINDISDSLRTTYWEEWNQPTTKSRLKQAVKKSFEQFFTDTVDRDLSNKHRKEIFINAVTVACLLDDGHLILSPDERCLVCKALLPQLKIMDNSHDECFNIACLRESFSYSSKKLIEVLYHLIQPMIKNPKDSHPAWLYTMPLLHFLAGKYSSFEPSDSSDHASYFPEWWGTSINKLTINFKQFKSNPIKHELLNETMEDLKEHFKADFLLARTLMACLRFDQLRDVVKNEHIPYDAILATLCYYITTEKNIVQRETDILTCLSRVELVAKKEIDTEYTDTMNLIKIRMIWRSSKISIDLLDGLLNRQVTDKIVISTLKAVWMLLHLLHIKVETTTDFSAIIDIRNDQYQMLAKIVEKSRHWMKHSLDGGKKFDLSNWIKNYNKLLSMKVTEGEFMTCFRKNVCAIVSERLEQKKYDQGLVNAYCKLEEDFCPQLLSVLNKYVFEALEKNSRTLNYDKWNENHLRKFGMLLSDVFDEKFTSRRNNGEVDRRFKIQFSITWQCLPLYIKICLQNSIVSSFLKEDCKSRIEDLIECLKSVEKHITEGDITISDLKILIENKANFFNAVGELPNINLNVLKRAFGMREQELNEYVKSLEVVTQFTTLCHRFEVDTTKLDSQIQKLKDIGKFRIDGVCITKTECLPTSEHAIFTLEVVAFNINKDYIRCMKDISKNSTSVLFLNIWDAIGTYHYHNNGHPLSIDEVITSVWNETKERMQRLKDSLSSGDICFGEFEELCGTFNDKEKLRQELKGLEDGPTPWVDTRINQIQMYKEAKSCIDVALAILDIVSEFKIEGDFTAISAILEMTEDQDTAMKIMGKNFDKVSKALYDITKQKMKCLRIFLQSKPLIDWLRERMKDNIRDLRMFVDLAYTSIGDDGLEIARVTSLQTAASGYAALIFDIPHVCNYDTFLDKCCDVWKAVELTPTLPEQLEDTCRFLDWFKNLEESHRSLHMTSFSQTEAINRNGRFLVGNLTKELNKDNSTMVEVLQLTVEEDDRGSSTPRLYTCEQLNDLQSKLMLIAGATEKSSAQKVSNERFLEIFEALKNLGDIYLKLLASGCVLFSNCQVEFRCDPASVVFIFISFGEKNDKHTIRGERQKFFTGLEELNDCSFIRKIVEFFERCLNEWQKFVDGKREKYLLLNNFTIKQLVILQKELADIGKGKDASRMIFPLLSTIKNGCTKGDILDAIYKTRKDIRENESKSSVTDDFKTQTHNSKEELVASFISNMTDAGFDEYVAFEALKHVQADDITEGISWCMENVDLIKKPQDNEENTGFQRDECWSTSRMLSDIGVDSTNGINTSKKEVLENLQKLWETFLKSTESSVADFLSVEHTAIILDNLAQTDTVTRSLKDTKCEPGEPNLLICPQIEVFNTVLSVYRQQKNQPLPQPDEVLLCSKETTSDLLDIFLRRSLFSSSNKIYCLINVDCLTYEVSDKGERLLNKYIQDASQKGSQYQFIVICSSENEFKSRIVAALDRYRRKTLQYKDDKIKDYLSYKCKVDVKNDLEPASCVDFGRSFVRAVKSFRSGVGKTLFVKTMLSTLEKKMNEYGSSQSEFLVSIPLHGKKVELDSITDLFLQYTALPESTERRIFHIDISNEVEEGVDQFLFELLILGRLVHSSGYMWRRSDSDYYIIESMSVLSHEPVPECGVPKSLHRCLDILPDIVCRSPLESLNILAGNYPDGYSETDLTFNDTEFKSRTYQSTYENLLYLENSKEVPIKRTKESLLKTYLRHCGVKDPSWSELFHFVNFLNRQLVDFEKSAFCSAHVASYLPGFRLFLLKLIIQMSRDFSTRSLEIKEESQSTNIKKSANVSEDNVNLALLYHMRKRWETSSHPYVFFNPDGHTMTFLGFYIDKRTLNLIDQKTNTIIEEKFITNKLLVGLQSQGVNLAEEFDKLGREQKILKLCTVMGITDSEYDPDPTYELTTDNVKKILAVYMRFRCDIPVVIMGETGCGKTRLVRFMCSLQRGNSKIENMIIMKIHGGTTTPDIIKKVRKAENIAKKNAIEHPNVYTVLFLDEANTTEAIGIIKQIMCDKTLDGKANKLYEHLKIVAACNPYRRHNQGVIKSLEQAGLGYHVSAETTSDTLGRIPMRQLVYRVQPLPKSMLPLVWDFGQLDASVEELYIRQMVLRNIREKKLPNITGLREVVSRLLSKCQEYMRTQKDECSFVSLRDVERVLQVTTWFQKQNPALNEYLKIAGNSTVREMSRSLLLAVKICYESCLKNRDEFNIMIKKIKISPLINDQSIQEEMSRCKEMFLKRVGKLKNIAHNQALEENVFLMVICIELRIPLFLVGKPGSSKSLAKTIVADVMQGKHSRSNFYKQYKEVQMVSFQCSPLSRADGIIGTFNQCAEFQKDKDLNKFVSVVVLDEVGLAEDSPRMPLKTLHSLLETGCSEEDEPSLEKKVAFIGISNYALDPAKMNRGIFVRRDVPDTAELIHTARGICLESSDRMLRSFQNLIPYLAESYMALFKQAEQTQKKEFFGLRDFYSLIKQVHFFATKAGTTPSWKQLEHAIMRNFGGLESVNPVEVFQECLKGKVIDMNKPSDHDPDCTPQGMIQACLSDENAYSETRYLLLLTENYGDLTVLQQKILAMHSAIVIFGSSFPGDQEYTKICRNINRIKICMETGQKVILLNLENLYESLYDALNQNYVYYGGQRYVDLGLGTHRVKCRVHPDFRLIVVAEKDTVYQKFQIPLINRLEKHVLSLSTIISSQQNTVLEQLNSWVRNICRSNIPNRERQISEVFLGHHVDTCAAIIFHLNEERNKQAVSGDSDDITKHVDTTILIDAKHALLWCSTPDVILSLNSAFLEDDKKELIKTYFKDQQHESLLQYIDMYIVQRQKQNHLVQVTTHSKLLSTADLDTLCTMLKMPKQYAQLLNLQSFNTELQFFRQIRTLLGQAKRIKRDNYMLIIVQCESGEMNGNLIICARYGIEDELKHQSKEDLKNVHIIMVVQIPRITREYFTGFQCGGWHSLHIDALTTSTINTPQLIQMYGKPVSALMKTQKGDKSDGEYHCMVNALIWKCMKSALSLIKDQQLSFESSKRRLDIVFTTKNLPIESNEGQNTFTSGLAAQLFSLFEQKEENFSQAYWLSTEAAKPENINRAGTFRRSVEQYIEDKMTPVLAGILANIDKNDNLNIISQNSNWKNYLWIEIFNSPEITELRYEDLLSQRHGEALSEFMIEVTSDNGESFQAEMPFSWCIFRQVENLWKSSTEKFEGSLLENITKTAQILLDMPVGIMLSKIKGEDIEEAKKCYLSDFVHMVYPVKNKSEHHVVCETILIGCKDFKHRQSGQFLSEIVGFHALFHCHNHRFMQFESIVNIWPKCSDETLKYFQTKKPATYEEITLDIVGLRLLVDHLELSKYSNLESKENRANWLVTLCQIRPVVERMLSCFSVETNISRSCRSQIAEVRCLWTRAVVMKLFIEHVCNPSGKQNKFCKALWTVMKDRDMKKLNFLEKLEMFLKSYTKSEASQLLKKEICDHCHSPYKDIPVFLQCNHTICKVCCNSSMTKAAIECPVCAKSTHQELHVESNEKRENIAELKSFTKRCNSFFMDVVSQLCFDGDTPPEDDVLAKLMSYITVHTDELWIYSKEFTIFDHCIDQIPKVRSFLLSKLMQSSWKTVNVHLKKFFQEALKCVDQTQLKQVNEVCFLVLNSLEDSFHQSYPSKSKSISRDVIDMLRAAEQKIILEKEFLFESIYNLARTRFAISIMADYIHRKYIEKKEKEDTCKAFFSAMDNFFKKCQSTWPKYFFIRYFCKAYGIADYQTLKKECPQRWKSVVTTPELEDSVENSCDRFVACTNYIVTRDKFLQLTSAENREQFLVFLKKVNSSWQDAILFLLILYRQFTVNLICRKENSLTKKVHIFIKEVVEKSDCITDKESSRDILNNRIWKICSEYNLHSGMDISKQGIQFLLVHMMIMVKNTPDKILLIAPFKNIAFNPAKMVKSYFPTMPQDDLKDIKQALLEARTDRENPVIYRCPKGHPYVIGDCGRPFVVGKCHTCGLQIGGKLHQPAAGNVKDDGVDRPEYGHLLGDASKSSMVLFPQRKLNVFSLTIMRLLTHLAMFIGSNSHLKAMQRIIHPSIDKNEVPVFIMRHIENDLNCLSKTCGKSKDDILLFMHSLLDFMVQKAKRSDTSRNDQLLYLQDKSSRQEWEDTINRLYLNPFNQIADKTVQKKNKEISKDKEYGDSGLFQLLHETDESSIPLQIDSVFCENPSVWGFRQHMTIGHIRQSSRTVRETCPVLHLFLEEESYLRALRFVPGIIRLQKMLILRFKGKLDKTEAHKYTLQTLIDNIQDKRYLADLNTYLEDFIKAWNMINQCLIGYNCEVDGIRLEFNGVYRGRVIDNNTPVSFFLPKQKDEGLCSYLLLHFLLEKQNSFLKQFSNCNPQGIRQGQLPLVRVKDITAAHMISYHPENDLLPMVLSNCNYTFQVGSGTQLVYDWQNLEKQLMDRFLFSKSIIILKEIDTMIYRSETTNAIVFASLRAKIKQERLSQLILIQIRAEVSQKTFPDLCDSLQNIDIAISFLKSVSAIRTSSFSDFMIRTLQLDDSCFGQKVTMSHIQSLWITLALEKTMRLQDCEKEAFDGIPSIFKEKLTEQHKTYLGGVVCDLQKEQIGRLLHSLFECILLTINIPQKDEQYVDMSTISLADALYEYLYDSPYEEEANESDIWLHETVSKMMSDDSTQLCCNCCVHAWIFIYEVYQWKQRNSEA